MSHYTGCSLINRVLTLENLNELFSCIVCYPHVTSHGIATCSEVGNLPNMYGMGWTERVVPLNVEVPICYSDTCFWKNALCVFFLYLCLQVVLCDLLCVLHLYFSLPDHGFPTFDICVFIVLILESILLFNICRLVCTCMFKDCCSNVAFHLNHLEPIITCIVMHLSV
jgi:hypothetical protein